MTTTRDYGARWRCSTTAPTRGPSTWSSTAPTAEAARREAAAIFEVHASDVTVVPWNASGGDQWINPNP